MERERLLEELPDAFQSAYKKSLTEKEPQQQNVDIQLEQQAPDEELEQPIEQQERAKDDDDGYGFVDIEDPAVQKRFNRLYKQVKASDEANRLLREHIANLEKSFSQIQQQQQVVQERFVSQEVQQARNFLQSEYQSAIDAGDFQRQQAIQQQWILLEAEVKAQEILKQQNAQPKDKYPPTNINQTVDQYDIPQDEAVYIDAWMNEKSPSGVVVREWAQPNHALFNAALAEAENVFKSPLWANKSVQERMAEVDRRMGLVKPVKQSAPQVLSSNLKTSPKRDDIKLTPQEEQIAIRMRLGKTPQESIERYKAQKRQMRGM